MDKSIKQVLALEAKVQGIKSDADTKVQKIIEKAKQDAIDLQEQLEEASNKTRNNAIKKAESVMARKRKALLARAQQKREILGSLAKKNMPKAMNLVLSILKKNV